MKSSRKWQTTLLPPELTVHTRRKQHKGNKVLLMNWWSLFSPANTIVGDGLSQASPNASHCLIFEDITVLDTTAKYSLCTEDFASYANRSFEIFKSTPQENTQPPLNIANSSLISLWCVVHVCKSDNHINFYEKIRWVGVLRHFSLTAQEPGKGNWDHKWKLTTMDAWQKKKIQFTHFIRIQITFLPCTYNLLLWSCVHDLLFFSIYIKRLGERKLFQVFWYKA